MESRAFEPRAAALVAALLAPTLANAEPTPLGTETQVNQYTFGSQDQPDIASDGEGFVVVWEGLSASDASADGVSSRDFTWDGVTAGADFQVNSYTTGDQDQPAVAISGTARFIVWEDAEGDGDGEAVVGRFESPEGARGIGEIVVNSYTIGDQSQPDLAAGADDGFLVVWRSPHDGSGDGVFGRAFDATGTPLASEIPVNDTTALNQSQPAVTPAADGEFFVMWQNNADIAGRRISSAGENLGVELDFGGVPGSVPSVARRGDAGLVAAFQASGTSGDGAGLGIVGLLLDAQGEPLGGTFVINSYTTGNQVAPDVASDADGRFLVSWYGFFQDIPGENSTGVFAQAFDTAGLPYGGELQVNAYTTSGQDNPSVTARPDGIFAIAWESNLQDGATNGVFVRRYDLANQLFEDGFEMGDTCEWTETVAGTISC